MKIEAYYYLRDGKNQNDLLNEKILGDSSTARKKRFSNLMMDIKSFRL